jgi:hypothetical protein
MLKLCRARAGGNHPIPMNARIFLSTLLPLSDDCSYLIAVERQNGAPALLQHEGTCAMAIHWVSDGDLMARGY